MTFYEWILSILKYTGILVAAGSSLWTATNVVSHEKDGKRQLTRAGKVSITLTLAGLVICIASNTLQDVVARYRAQQATVHELKRMNRIILAGQPLTGLKLTWRFDGVSKGVRDFMEIADNKIFEEWDQRFFNVQMQSDEYLRLNSYYMLYPFLAFLSHDSMKSNDDEKGAREREGSVALISLDNGPNAVLPLGVLEAAISPSVRSIDKKESENLKLPYGLRYQQDPWDFGHEPKDAPLLELHSDGALLVNWDLDPDTFYNSVDRREKDIVITAGLPSDLRIVIFYDVQEWPFSLGSIIKSDRDFIWRNLWQEDRDGLQRTPKLFSKSSIELVPNGLVDGSVKYILRRMVENPVLDKYGEDCKCSSLLFIYERDETRRSLP